MRNSSSVIVIGASAGGFKAITALLAQIPPDLDAALFIVLHVSKFSSGTVLSQLMQKATTIKCHLAEDNLTIETGHLYIAPPDFHLIVKQGYMRLIKGPDENRWRPSIDVLFRSAAVAYNSRVIGIVLSGLLDDGTAGMVAVKRCGGLTIVQEPHEAEFDDMPVNVLKQVDVDYQVSIADIGYILDDICSKPTRNNAEVPEEISIEAGITENMVSEISDLEKIGKQSNYTCPDCGGSLWSVKNESNRFRCFTGHVYSERLLLEKQNEKLEESIWISIRILEERKDLLKLTALHQHELGNLEMETYKTEQSEEINRYIETLKGVVASISKST